MDDRQLAQRSARDLGFDVVIDPSRENLADAVKKATGGRGPEVIAECSGHSDRYPQFVDMLASCGRIVMVGNPFTGQVTLDLLTLQRKEASLITSKACIGADYDRVLDMVRWGKVKLNWMDGTAITTYSMDEFPKARQEWMDLERALYVVKP